MYFEPLPSSVLAASSVAIVISPRRSGKSTLIRSCVPVQNPDITIVHAKFHVEEWHDFVPKCCIFTSKCPDATSLPLEHKKCIVIADKYFRYSSYMDVMGARFTNTTFWLETDSNHLLPPIVMSNVDLVFLRHVDESKVRHIHRMCSSEISLKKLQEHLEHTDNLPYTFTVLAFNNEITQIFKYTSNPELKKVGSATFWEEMEKLQENKYLKYMQ